MYHYYAQVAAGVTVWWKEWVTRLQIAQFVIDVIACWFAILSNYLYKPCAGALLVFAFRLGLKTLSFS
jgi:hypothetical protein